MQLWFWAAVVGMVLAGISNFGFKIAAKNGFNSDIFTLYGGISSIFVAGIGLFLLQPEFLDSFLIICITVLAGVLASQSSVFKVLALRYIDSTIFFPLFKLFSPLLAVLLGIIFFNESFTILEWIGIILGLIIPLLLVNKSENTRQKNLFLGLFMVILISIISAAAAALNNYAIDAGMNEWVTLWYASWGIFVGSFIVVMGKIRTIPWKFIIEHTNVALVQAAIFRSTLISLSMVCVLYAYGHGGDLGIVQTIHSMYIIIPIVLAVLIYQEHINWNKAIAVILSVVALFFLG